ncbi:MAG: hypothetical protein JWN12_744 [Candidatus Saccharibacteria bacterium]|nr:hypothetical protein [Candidatus Saccharibacteria bacterium]
MAVLGGWRLTRAGVLFIVGILVLGGLVTGGIFLVKNHGEAVRHDQAVKVAEQNLKDQSQTATQPTNTSGSSDSTNAGTTNTAGTDTSTSSTTAAGNSSTTELPVTGIDDLQVLGRAAILAVLALSAAYYVTSRRASQRR